VVVVAPCSANTAAKIALGIADSLVTNIVSQALKSCVKVVVLPTDAEPEVTGKTVSGKDVRIRCRRVDLENVERLKQEMVVVRNKTELEKALS
jgi:flavoprotein